MDSAVTATVNLLRFEQIRTMLQLTRKFGCSFLLTDPQGAEIEQGKTQPLAAFMRKLNGGEPK